MAEELLGTTEPDEPTYLEVPTALVPANECQMALDRGNPTEQPVLIPS